MSTVAKDSDVYSLRPEEPRTSNKTFCRGCGEVRGGGFCQVCGVDLDTGDLVGVPREHPNPREQHRDLLGDSDSDSDLEPIDPADPDPGAVGAVPAAFEALAPDPDQPVGYQPLRAFDPHHAPDSTLEMLHRASKEGLAGLAPPLLYLPLTFLPITFQTVPWVNEPFPWPGQAMATYVLGFCLLERTRSAREEAVQFNVLELGGTLWRTLIFIFPLLTALGSLPYGETWEALLLIPPLVVLLPLLLGALATDCWGELTPRALFISYRETPNYTPTAVVSSLALVVSLAAIWAFPLENALPRALVAVAGATLAGAVIGCARRDAEILSLQGEKAYRD